MFTAPLLQALPLEYAASDEVRAKWRFFAIKSSDKASDAKKSPGKAVVSRR